MSSSSRLLAPVARLEGLAGLARLSALAACSMVALGAQAAALYGNFNPTLAAGDFSRTDYADISGYCVNFWCSSHFNIYSAGFNFTAQGSGTAARAYLPLQAISSYPGAERFYRISIYDSHNLLVAQGGLLGRYVPVGGAAAVYEFELTRDYEAGQTLAASADIVAGETYTAYFHQRFGSLSQTHWMESDVEVQPGQGYVQCATNVGGICASNWNNYWEYPFGNSYTQQMTGFLPALALTDGHGFIGPDPTGAVPEPASLALVGLALAGLGCSRRTRAGG